MSRVEDLKVDATLAWMALNGANASEGQAFKKTLRGLSLSGLQATRKELRSAVRVTRNARIDLETLRTEGRI